MIPLMTGSGRSLTSGACAKLLRSICSKVAVARHRCSMPAAPAVGASTITKLAPFEPLSASSVNCSKPARRRFSRSPSTPW